MVSAETIFSLFNTVTRPKRLLKSNLRGIYLKFEIFENLLVINHLHHCVVFSNLFFKSFITKFRI